MEDTPEDKAAAEVSRMFRRRSHFSAACVRVGMPQTSHASDYWYNGLGVLSTVRGYSDEVQGLLSQSRAELMGPDPGNVVGLASTPYDVTWSLLTAVDGLAACLLELEYHHEVMMSFLENIMMRRCEGYMTWRTVNCSYPLLYHEG